RTNLLYLIGRRKCKVPLYPSEDCATRVGNTHGRRWWTSPTSRPCHLAEPRSGGSPDSRVGTFNLRFHFDVTAGLAVLWVPLASPVRDVRWRDCATKSVRVRSFCCRC